MNVRLKSDKHLLVSNAAALGFGTLVKMIVQFTMLPLMAYLIGPSEFGLFSFVMPTIQLFNLLADGGLGESLAKVDETDKETWSTGFWSILILCLTLSVIVCLGGYVIAHFSGQPRVASIMMVISPTFLLFAVSTVAHARITRRGKLNLHVLADLTGVAVGSGFAIFAAVKGLGVWSLVIQYMAYTICRAIVLNCFAFEIPILSFDFKSLKPHLLTGGSIVAGRLSDSIARILENLIFGSVFGTSALGSYSLANQSSRYIVEMFGNPLWGSLYAFSIKNSLIEIMGVHIRTSRVLASVSIPISFLAASAAPDILPIILGHKWNFCAEIIRIILPSYVFVVIATQTTAILYAKSFNFAAFLPGFTYVIMRVIAVASGQEVGIYPALWEISALNVIYAISMYLSTKIICGAQILKIAPDILYPTFASVICSVLYTASVAYYPYVKIIKSGIIYDVGMLLCCYLCCLIIIFALNGDKLIRDAKLILRALRNK